MFFKHTICARLTLGFAASAHALPAIFGNQMILQRDMPYPIYGTHNRIFTRLVATLTQP
jgi:hypothetical protein